MNKKAIYKVKEKTEIRKRLLKGFAIILFFSYLFNWFILTLVARILDAREVVYDRPPISIVPFLGENHIITILSMSLMFLIAVAVTFFLADSLTRPIKQLADFASKIGKGDFNQNNFEFREKELEELNIALNNSAKQLSIYDSEQKTFFQNASHELRTPLMSIKCYAEGISFGIMDSKEAADTILKETDRLSGLVTNLLYISKLDNITKAFTPTEADLVKIITSSVERHQALADKKNIRFTLNFKEEHVNYNCVSELISRAVDNLISNAIRYANSEITISCVKTRSFIEIKVADDGKGIEEEAKPHLFERFYKGSDGNHGIGLSIVKTIIEQHKGKITAKNNEDGGAVFNIILPIGG